MNRNVNTNINTNQDYNSIYNSLFNQLTSNLNVEEKPIGIEAVVAEPEPEQSVGAAAEDAVPVDLQENAEGKAGRYYPVPQSSSSNYNSNYNYNQNSNYDYNSIFASLFEQLKNQQTIDIEKPNKPVHNYEK